MASEHALQVAVAHMLELVLDPERTWFSSIDHGAGKLSKRAAGMMRARGVRAGMPDIIIMPEYKPLIGIELKTERGRMTPPQILTQRKWLKLGHLIFVARSLEEVQQILEREGVPMRRRLTIFPTLKVPHERAQRSAPARHQRPRRRGKSKNHLPLVLADAAQKN